MKRMMALLVCLALVLCTLSAGAESEFSAHLQQLVTEKMNLQNNDLAVKVEAAGLQLDIRAGLTDNGLCGTLAAGDQEMGALQIGKDAALLSMMGQTMGVKYETLQNVLGQSMPAAGGNLPSPEQLQEDMNTVLAAVATNLQGLMGSLGVEQTEDGEVKLTLNGPAFAEAFGQAGDAFVADEKVQAVLNRYAAMVPEMNLQKAWSENRASIVDSLSKINGEMIMSQEGSYSLTAHVDSEKPVDITSEGSTDPATQAIKSTTLVMQDGKQVASFDLAADATGATVDLVAEEVECHEKMGLENGTLKTIDYVLTENGETSMEFHYADYKFTLKGSGAELTVEKGFSDADHLEVLFSGNVNGAEFSGKLTETIADDSLIVEADIGGAITKVTVSGVEKGEYANLAESENVNWLTEEMLGELAGSFAGGLMEGAPVQQ